jgi:hypothetical protein
LIMKRLFYTLIILLIFNVSYAQPPEQPGGGGGSGDVTASGTITDNNVVCGDGGVKGIKDCAATGAVNLYLEDGNGAAPTADGLIKYDRTTERVQIGDGVGTTEFYKDAHTVDTSGFTADGQTQLTPTTAIVLDEATGNEIAFTTSFTCNKATSGDCYGWYQDITDTSSPDDLYHWYLSTGGALRSYLDLTGFLFAERLLVEDTTGNYLIDSSVSRLLVVGEEGVVFRQNLDRLAGDVFTFASASGGVKMEDTDGRQAFASFAPRTEQSGTAAFDGIYLNLTNTSLGDGTTGDGNNLINLAVGGTSAYRVDTDGYPQQSTCHGELYETGGSTAITITTGGTYYQWVNSTVGLESGNGFVDCDATTDDCIIESATCAGIYKINLNSSFSGENSAVVNCAIAVNDAESSKIIFERTLALPATIGSASSSGLVSLSNGDAVTVECTSDSNGDTVTPHILNMVMHKIN